MLIEALDKRRVTGRKTFLSRKPRSLARLYELELNFPTPTAGSCPGCSRAWN